MLIDSAETLRRFFPNTLLECDDEISFFDKVSPYLQSREKWLFERVIGDDLSDKLDELAVADIATRIVANLAIADAMPSLDIVLTPNGLGVISTDSLAPASSDRVERLIASLNSSATVHLELLIDKLHTAALWRDSSRGEFFCATFVQSLAETARWRGKDEPLQVFNRIRDIAISFENVAAVYVGENTLKTLRNALAQSVNDYSLQFIISTFKQAENKYINCHQNDKQFSLPDPLEVFTLVSQTASLVARNAKLSETYLAEVDKDSVTFNQRQGAAFF